MHEKQELGVMAMKNYLNDRDLAYLRRKGHLTSTGVKKMISSISIYFLIIVREETFTGDHVRI